MWTEDKKRDITPERLIESLKREEHVEVSSPRPALLAHTLSCMSSAEVGDAETVISSAVNSVIEKLKTESLLDTVIALLALSDDERVELRSVAAGEYTNKALKDIKHGHDKFRRISAAPTKLAQFVECLAEAGHEDDPVRLQPPYTALLLSWINKNGALAVRVDGDRISLTESTLSDLVFIAECRKEISEALRANVSRAVMESLAHNGLGFHGDDGTVKPPVTAAEFDSIHALQNLNLELNGESKPKSDHYLFLAASHANPNSKSEASVSTFENGIGWELLLAFRHFKAHIWYDTPHIVRNGLTAAVVTNVVDAAMKVLTDKKDGCFVDNPGSSTRWTLRVSPTKTGLKPFGKSYLKQRGWFRRQQYRR